MGNAVGTTMLQIASDGALSEKEQDLMKAYFESVSKLEQELHQQYQTVLQALSIEFAEHMKIIEMLSSPNVEEALNGSVEMAKHLGISAERSLIQKKRFLLISLT